MTVFLTLSLTLTFTLPCPSLFAAKHSSSLHYHIPASTYHIAMTSPISVASGVALPKSIRFLIMNNPRALSIWLSLGALSALIFSKITHEDAFFSHAKNNEDPYEHMDSTLKGKDHSGYRSPENPPPKEQGFLVPGQHRQYLTLEEASPGFLQATEPGSYDYHDITQQYSTRPMSELLMELSRRANIVSMELPRILQEDIPSMIKLLKSNTQKALAIRSLFSGLRTSSFANEPDSSLFIFDRLINHHSIYIDHQDENYITDIAYDETSHHNGTQQKHLDQSMASLGLKLYTFGVNIEEFIHLFHIRQPYQLPLVFDNLSSWNMYRNTELLETIDQIHYKTVPFPFISDKQFKKATLQLSLKRLSYAAQHLKDLGMALETALLFMPQVRHQLTTAHRSKNGTTHISPDSLVYVYIHGGFSQLSAQINSHLFQSHIPLSALPIHISDLFPTSKDYDLAHDFKLFSTYLAHTSQKLKKQHHSSPITASRSESFRYDVSLYNLTAMARLKTAVSIAQYIIKIYPFTYEIETTEEGSSIVIFGNNDEETTEEEDDDDNIEYISLEDILKKPIDKDPDYDHWKVFITAPRSAILHLMSPQSQMYHGHDLIEKKALDLSDKLFSAISSLYALYSFDYTTLENDKHFTEKEQKDGSNKFNHELRYYQPIVFKKILASKIIHKQAQSDKHLKNYHNHLQTIKNQPDLRKVIHHLEWHSIKNIIHHLELCKAFLST
ncbi:MAG: hypothetical protein OXC44_00290 [Proteobacteria bacterium]|nr:hypothetical protein [Pseudomonadota bacterium]